MDTVIRTETLPEGSFASTGTGPGGTLEECPNCEQDYEHHKEWCLRIPRHIYGMFSGLFRDVYNVIELAVEKDRAEKIKDLVGDRIMKLRNDLVENTSEYLRSKKLS